MAGFASKPASTPPALIRMVAAQIPNSEVVIVREAGHSSYWEQPEAFNRAVLDFLARHSKWRPHRRGAVQSNPPECADLDDAETGPDASRLFRSGNGLGSQANVTYELCGPFCPRLLSTSLPHRR